MASDDDSFVENDLRRRFAEIFEHVKRPSDLDVMLRQLQMTVLAMAKRIEEQKKQIALLTR